jgi:hypothetical protein
MVKERHFNTEDGIAIDIAANDRHEQKGRVTLAVDGVVFSLSASDAARLGTNLRDIAETAAWLKGH